ncbi:MAG: bacterioferritin [Ostreibacterium sp.]
MKGEQVIIAQLNTVLRHQLITINQYFLHARMLKNWGMETLGKAMYQQSITEMKNADKIISRILLLENLPNLQDLGKLLIGENIVEILDCDLKAEKSKHKDLITAIAHCENGHDYVSRQLLTTIKNDNEDYIDWVETQQQLIHSVGLENYLQTATE